MTLDEAVEKSTSSLTLFLTKQSTANALDKAIYEVIGNETYVFVSIALDQSIEKTTQYATGRVIDDHLDQVISELE